MSGSRDCCLDNRFARLSAVKHGRYRPWQGVRCLTGAAAHAKRVVLAEFKAPKGMSGSRECCLIKHVPAPVGGQTW